MKYLHKTEFNKAAGQYNEALKSSGFNVNIEYKRPKKIATQDKAKRRKKIIRFNPPYSRSVRTNVSRTFLSLIDKHFRPKWRSQTIFRKEKIRDKNITVKVPLEVVKESGIKCSIKWSIDLMHNDISLPCVTTTNRMLWRIVIKIAVNTRKAFW